MSMIVMMKLTVVWKLIVERTQGYRNKNTNYIKNIYILSLILNSSLSI